MATVKQESAEAGATYVRSSVERPLTTGERASFVIISLYLFVFCLCAFVYWDSLILKILGLTALTMGLFLFLASFFNRESPEERTSIHPLRSYLTSFLLVLATLFAIRFIGGRIDHQLLSVVVVYTGTIVSLVVFRRAMIQVVTTMIAASFLFVTFYNWDSVLSRKMDFHDAVSQCGQALFRIAPIQDMANMLIAGSYYAYLGKIDYRDEQINAMATRLVRNSGDDEIEKTRALLAFVSRKIRYVSDPGDGLEYAKKPIMTLIAGGGDCEDQTLLLCSMLESVGVKTYIAFTDEHVFPLVRFASRYPDPQVSPFATLDDGAPLYAIDPTADPARIGNALVPFGEVRRVFETIRSLPVEVEPVR